MGPDAMIFVFWMLSFKPTFSLSSFTFIKRLFRSSRSAIMVVSSAYLRLLIFLPATLIPACASSCPAFLVMYSAYNLNKQGDNIKPWCTPYNMTFCGLRWTVSGVQDLDWDPFANSVLISNSYSAVQNECLLKRYYKERRRGWERWRKKGGREKKRRIFMSIIIHHKFEFFEMHINKVISWLFMLNLPTILKIGGETMWTGMCWSWLLNLWNVASQLLNTALLKIK